MPATATTGTPRIWQMIRAYVLAFEGPDGKSPADELGAGDAGRMYYVQAPDHPTYPYVIGRLMAGRTTMGVRKAMELELIIIDRPRARQVAAEQLADIIEGALQGFRSSAAGFVMTSAPDRDTLPVTPTPGDREEVQIRLVSPVIAYPQYLSQHSIPG